MKVPVATECKYIWLSSQVSDKNMESADISIMRTGDDVFIVFNKEYVSRSHRQTDLSIEPVNNTIEG